MSDTKASDEAVTKPEGDVVEKVYPASEFKEAIKRRDDALQARRELEQKNQELESQLKAIEDKQVIEKEEWKSAYEKIKPEYETIKSELEKYKARIDAIEQAQEAKVNDGVSKLPDDEKTEYEKYIAKLSLDERAGWLEEKLAKRQGGGTSPASSRASGASLTKKPSEMSYEERLKALQSNPQAFSKVVKNG